MKWPKVTIQTSDGVREAIAPQVISASRSTDIPTFYSDWFMRRLEVGYVRWINPFNRKCQYVSFEKTRAIVFWSKNPKPMLKYLDNLQKRNLAFYFQYTINDYEKEGLEPNVPPLEDRIETFVKLSQRLGKERVIWRFDPLVLAENIRVEDLLKKIESIGNELHSYTEKLVFSFADIDRYLKVKRNLLKAGGSYKEFTLDAMKDVAVGLRELMTRWGIEISTCGEKVDLSKYGIGYNKCVDADLLMRISKNDPKLLKFFGYEDISQQTLFDFKEKRKKTIKDRGQRLECGCVFSKDIGQYNTCEHLCIYCYANTSAKVVLRNTENLNLENDAILGDCC